MLGGKQILDTRLTAGARTYLDIAREVRLGPLLETQIRQSLGLRLVGHLSAICTVYLDLIRLIVVKVSWGTASA
jgi:hypothetical protein